MIALGATHAIRYNHMKYLSLTLRVCRIQNALNDLIALERGSGEERRACFRCPKT